MEEVKVRLEEEEKAVVPLKHKVPKTNKNQNDASDF